MFNCYVQPKNYTTALVLAVMHMFLLLTTETHRGKEEAAFWYLLNAKTGKQSQIMQQFHFNCDFCLVFYKYFNALALKKIIIKQFLSHPSLTTGLLSSSYSKIIMDKQSGKCANIQYQAY